LKIFDFFEVAAQMIDVTSLIRLRQGSGEQAGGGRQGKPVAGAKNDY